MPRIRAFGQRASIFTFIFEWELRVSKKCESEVEEQNEWFAMIIRECGGSGGGGGGCTGRKQAAGNSI